MSEFQLIMPKMGESIAEATIIRWLKNEGETIAPDESVLEIATDKVDSEVPAPKGGILTKKLFKDGDVIAVGTVIAIIETAASAAAKPAPIIETVNPVIVSEPIKQVEKISIPDVHRAAQPLAAGNKFYSPLVLNIARSENISMSELDNIQGTGNEGRVTKRDVLSYIKSGKVSVPFVPQNETEHIAENASYSEPEKTEALANNTNTQEIEEKEIIREIPKEKISTSPNEIKITQPKVQLMQGDEIIEMDRMRKLIAEHMVMSKHVSPHVTSFVEADVTNLVMWRNKIKLSFEKREGEKITFTPCFVEAVVKSIKDFPLINVAVDGDKIIKRKMVNIGMAAALPSGNLIVPVIKNADMLNLIGITKTVNDLANRARNNKLSPDDIQGGTFTITNVGGFGNVMGTPIINQPQVAILATGTIKKKPAVLETAEGDVIGIRHMMFLSLSYDHRVVDGALGGTFLRRVADYLEQWDMNREL